ncbi:UvrD-helicase domain-containing protein [Paenibacillus sp. TSA_86.1]|uniref:UvrD-helicase domain-containing protein n=1 Tax=Paenibacillus sp. TSA_86.1 TaxID=3415649 RepID=UPI0040456AE1
MLTPTQEDIVATQGNLIVRASAGTGKTHIMVTKITKEIKERMDHKVIASITFTIKAAQEIKDRITIDVSRHFVGTNNGFVIEEIIKPFMKDAYGTDFDVDMSTDYSSKISDFQQGIEKIRNEQLLCSYDNSNKKSNFIFQLALDIVKKSKVCQLYLKSKFFKIYIDEYQDCDKDMHAFFIHVSDVLLIDTFIVGDEKQSIYMWRGAYPEAFKGIWTKANYNKIFMGDNFRSCEQIQNYSNLLFSETRSRYISVKDVNDVILLNSTHATWVSDVKKLIDLNKRVALLRYSKDNAKNGAIALSQGGINCKYIPPLPLSDITTEVAWLYLAIAKYYIIEQYSVYDLIYEIPSEGQDSKRSVKKIEELLKKVWNNINDFDTFNDEVESLAAYLNYTTKREHVILLLKTITDSVYHVAFEPDNDQNVAITFHSSKGLEFDQVIVFSNDYTLNNMETIYNHYVAVTRAKTKLIVIKTGNFISSYERNLSNILAESHLGINDVMKII